MSGVSSLDTFELHMAISEVDVSGSLDLVGRIACDCELSKNSIKETINKGALWITPAKQKKTRRLRRVKTKLAVGDQLHFYYDPVVLQQQVPAARLISSDEEVKLGYSIWYKPYGMYCQGSKWADHCTIVRSVEQQTHSNAYLVHRLDRATQGLIVVAHKKQVAALLSQMFKERKVEKNYQAVVEGVYLAEDDSARIDIPIDDKPAVSYVKPLSYCAKNNTTLVEVKIETGRKHQIRKHLSQSGFPIVGDRLYGTYQEEGDERASEGNAESKQDINLQLYAYKLSFTCPVTQKERSYSCAGL